MNIRLYMSICVYVHWSERFFFCCEGSRTRSYGLTAALSSIVQPCDDDRRFFVFPCNGAPVEWNWQGKTEVLGEKPVPVPLCPPQIPHGLTRDRTRASAVRAWRLTPWAMARPIREVYNMKYPDEHKNCSAGFFRVYRLLVISRRG
jgi:hypothetical protein